MKSFLKIASLLLLPAVIAAQPDNQKLASLYRALSNAVNDTARMEIYSSLGSYFSLENRDSSEYYLEKALPIAIRLNLKLNEASILNAMGILQMQQEQFAKSLEYYLRAINIAKDPNVEKTIWHLMPGQSPTQARMLEMSYSYDFIGLLNAYTGNWIDNINNQLKNYREAGKYAIASGNEAQIASVKFHMGIAYMNAGKLDSALLFIKEAQSVFLELKDPQLGRTKIYQGETYQRMGDFDLAAKTIRQALILLNETNDNVHKGLGYTSLSRVYADMGKIDSALYYAKESMMIFERRKDPAWKRDACNLIASFYDQLGKSDSSIVYLKLAKTLSDSLSVEERKSLLAFQDVVVDEQAKLENLEKEKIETREKLKVYLLLTGIIVFVVIVLLLYRNNRARKKANEILHQRNEKIEKTFHQLRSTQAQLIQSEKMASLGELTAGIAHEIQNPLNFVNNFSEVNSELIEEQKKELERGNLSEAKILANEIAENEKKITHHGKRADGIVKSMLQHSQKSSDQKELRDINALCDEYARLAYHGFKAKDQSFNATIKTDLDPDLPQMRVIPQDIGRVLFNLVNNALYAVSGVEQPEVVVSTKYSPSADARPDVLVGQVGNGVVEIRVSDNGPGIPDSIKDKIFQPFFTTKPTGQGTGLGLSLAYDIVKAHGGEIKLRSSEGETEFNIYLPIG